VGRTVNGGLAEGEQEVPPAARNPGSIRVSCLDVAACLVSLVGIRRGEKETPRLADSARGLPAHSLHQPQRTPCRSARHVRALLPRPQSFSAAAAILASAAAAPLRGGASRLTMTLLNPGGRGRDNLQR